MKNKFYLLSIIAVLLTTSTTSAQWLVNDQKELQNTQGQVLGKSDKAQGKPDNPGNSSQNRGNSDTTRNENDEIVATDEVEATSNQNRGQEKKASKATTIKIAPGQGKKLSITTYDQAGDEILSTDSATLDIEEPDDTDVVKIRGNSNANAVIRNKVAAQTKFPLQVNLETNELLVTTPKGTKIVTVLPDKAVENMLAANVLDQLGGKGGLKWLAAQEATASATPEASSSGTPEATDSATPVATNSAETTSESSQSAAVNETTEYEPVDNVVELTEDEDGTLIYKISGKKNKKFLGFRIVELDREAIVSAETGELIRIEQSFLDRLIEMLSTN